MSKPYTAEQLKQFAGCRVIGIGHHSRVGKDFVAQAMIERAAELDPSLFKSPMMPQIKVTGRVHVLKFADPMKDAAAELFGQDGMMPAAAYEGDPPYAASRRAILPTMGGRNAVDVWIEMGRFLNAIRPGWMESRWRNAVRDLRYPCRANDPLILATDMRRPGEVDAVRAVGGKTIRILKKGWQGIPASIDQELDGWPSWDLTVEFEDGDIAGLEQFAEELLAACDPVRWPARY